MEIYQLWPMDKEYSTTPKGQHKYFQIRGDKLTILTRLFVCWGAFLQQFSPKEQTSFVKGSKASKMGLYPVHLQRFPMKIYKAWYIYKNSHLQRLSRMIYKNRVSLQVNMYKNISELWVFTDYKRWFYTRIVHFHRLSTMIYMYKKCVSSLPLFNDIQEPHYIHRLYNLQKTCSFTGHLLMIYSTLHVYLQKHRVMCPCI